MCSVLKVIGYNPSQLCIHIERKWNYHQPTTGNTSYTVYHILYRESDKPKIHLKNK